MAKGTAPNVALELREALLVQLPRPARFTELEHDLPEIDQRMAEHHWMPGRAGIGQGPLEEGQRLLHMRTAELLHRRKRGPPRRFLRRPPLAPPGPLAPLPERRLLGCGLMNRAAWRWRGARPSVLDPRHR